MIAKAAPANDVGGPDDASSLSGDTLVLDGRYAKDIEPRPSRQVGLEAFFARASAQGGGGANPVAGDAAASAVDGRTGVAWGKSFAPPAHMHRGRVDSLESMLGWPAQYNAALHQSVPGGILSFLKEQLGGCPWQCFCAGLRQL